MSSPENATDSSSNSSLVDNDEENGINNNNNKHFVLPTELYKNLLANAVLGKAETMHFSSPGQSNLSSIPAFPRNLLFSSAAESTDEVLTKELFSLVFGTVAHTRIVKSFMEGKWAVYIIAFVRDREIKNLDKILDGTAERNW
jgi:hypothetical protein